MRFNMRAADRLATETTEPVRRFLQRVLDDPSLVAEAEQETQLLLLERMRSGFRPRRVVSWALRVAWLKAQEVRRRAQRGGTRPVAPGDALVPDASKLVELRDWLLASMRGIDPEDRALLQLRYGEELAYKDIARILGMPVGSMGRRLRAARRELHGALIRSDGEAHLLLPILPALLPLLGPVTSSPGGPVAGAILKSTALALHGLLAGAIMKTGTLIGSITVLVVLVCGVEISVDPHVAPLVAEEASADPGPFVRRDEGSHDVAPLTSVRYVEAIDAPPGMVSLAGCVVDTKEQPVEAKLCLMPWSSEPASWRKWLRRQGARPSPVSTAKDGTFDLQVPDDNGRWHNLVVKIAGKTFLVEKLPNGVSELVVRVPVEARAVAAKPESRQTITVASDDPLTASLDIRDVSLTTLAAATARVNAQASLAVGDAKSLVDNLAAVTSVAYEEMARAIPYRLENVRGRIELDSRILRLASSRRAAGLSGLSRIRKATEAALLRKVLDASRLADATTRALREQLTVTEGTKLDLSGSFAVLEATLPAPRCLSGRAWSDATGETFFVWEF
ncbi:MAG: hypothetical protein CMJ83_06090 [Planctomycetes bacterium]|nr:hypothetical protein [Planctomycetota bacterium]